MKGRDPSTIMTRRRNIAMDRLDRSAWSLLGLEKKIDTHLLHPGFGSKWENLKPLLRYMYYSKGAHFEDYVQVEQYKENFVKEVGETVKHSGNYFGPNFISR